MQDDRREKVYVEVVVDFGENGVMLPREIIWNDGVRFAIDRVKQICQAASRKVGGQGDRYTIMVQGRETYLFFERSTDLTGPCIGKWFVEKKIA